MKIGLVVPVKPSHPYLVDDPAWLLDLHYLRISPGLWFSILLFTSPCTPNNVLQQSRKFRHLRIDLARFICSTFIFPLT